MGQGAAAPRTPGRLRTGRSHSGSPSSGGPAPAATPRPTGAAPSASLAGLISPSWAARLIRRLDRQGENVSDADRQPDSYDVVPAIDPELAEHTHLYLPPQVHHIGDRVHCAVGWNIANITMIEGDDGIVIVDTGMDLRQGDEVLAELRRITDKPIVAIVLTHHHVDHVQGTSSFVDAERRAGRRGADLRPRARWWTSTARRTCWSARS